MYSAGATNSTWPWHSSGLSAKSRRRPLPSRTQKYSGGTSLINPHTLHFQRWPPCTNWTNGLIYVRHRRHLIIPQLPKLTKGTPSMLFISAIGCMTAPNGRPHFCFSAFVQGMALVVTRKSEGSHWPGSVAGGILQFPCPLASSEGVRVRDVVLLCKTNWRRKRGG